MHRTDRCRLFLCRESGPKGSAAREGEVAADSLVDVLKGIVLRAPREGDALDLEERLTVPTWFSDDGEF